MLHAKIKNFSYQKCWQKNLKTFQFEDINILPSKCLVCFENKTFALSKWVSPKRTRSYPYARVYDTFDGKASKVVSVIPLFKDEGANGDMDFLQWDTLSLMSLLNVYVIIGFYGDAELHKMKSNKITNQQYDNSYIVEELKKLTNYHQSALHWNLNQLESAHLFRLSQFARDAHVRIGQTLNLKLHSMQNIDRFIAKIIQSKETFMAFSRMKAQQAQNREALTMQPKEHIGIGKKAKITIENYLGGQYFFTIDDVLIKNDTLYLCESKHSKNTLLPSGDDIKDGLLKLMLYKNLDSIVGYKKFRPVLRLTSTLLQGSFVLPCENMNEIMRVFSFSESQITILRALNQESQKNNFEVWMNDGRF